MKMTKARATQKFILAVEDSNSHLKMHLVFLSGAVHFQAPED